MFKELGALIDAAGEVTTKVKRFRQVMNGGV